MSMEEADAEKKAEMPELDLWGSGRNSQGHRSKSASNATVATGTKNAAGEATMEAVVARENMLRALRAVERNAGAAGVDGMTTEELRGYLRAQWEQLKRQLLEGTYQPQPVRRVDIPKLGGGTRMLGIPTVVDRLIQQAMHQVMSRSGNRTSPTIVTGFGPDEERIRRWKPPGLTSSRDAAGWSISTWRSFSTGSTTTC